LYKINRNVFAEIFAVNFVKIVSRVRFTSWRTRGRIACNSVC